MAKKTKYYSSREETSSKTFHKPEAYGDLQKIPMTTNMTILSIVSIIVQFGLTVLAVWAAYTNDVIPSLADTGYSSSLIYMVFPVLGWLFVFCFRLLCVTVPIDMWRFPAEVKKGIKLSNGAILKTITLHLELVASLGFAYMIWALVKGGEPSVIVIIIWIILLAIVIVFPCRKALRLVDSQRAEKRRLRDEKEARKAARK